MKRTVGVVSRKIDLFESSVSRPDMHGNSIKVKRTLTLVISLL